MPLRPGDTAPYAPPAQIRDVIAKFRDRGLGTPFTIEVLARAGVPESLIPRTLKAFENLELTDENGNPTEALEGLRRVPTAEFNDHLAKIVKGVYADVFQFVDPATDSLEQIGDAFRPYNPAGQRRRMVTLFIGLCDAAGLIPDEAPAKPGAERTTHATSRARKATKGSNGTPRSSKPSAAKTSSRKGYGGTIPRELVGLLESLPQDGEGWTQARRDKFVTAFKVVLDFAVPIIEPDKSAADDDAGGNDT